VAGADERLRTVDLDSGAVVADIAIDGMRLDGPGSIGVTADVLVNLISSGPVGRVEAIDRLSGRLRSPTRELAQTSGGRTRPDGTLVTWGPSLDRDVIDPWSDPLVERSVDLAVDGLELHDNDATVTVDGEQATLLTYQEGSRPMVYDLRDGDGHRVSLRTSDGRPFPATRAYPTDDGLVAVSDDQRVGLWVGDVQVDEMVVESDRFGLFGGTRNNDPFLIVATLDGSGTVEDQHLLEIREGRVEPRFTVTGGRTAWDWPMSDGGLWRVGLDGLAEFWDASGALLESQSFDIPDAARVRVFASDEHGRVAWVRADAPGGLSRIEIRDLERGETTELTAPGLVNWMGFARDGELLALQMVDGTVRLMDVASGVTGGVLWDGDGTQERTPWYDATTDSIWVAAREQIVQLPVDPAVWRERACASVTRELTATEWAELVPGDEPQVPACPSDG
jgi:WD40 repeat protein